MPVFPPRLSMRWLLRDVYAVAADVHAVGGRCLRGLLVV